MPVAQVKLKDQRIFDDIWHIHASLTINQFSQLMRAEKRGWDSQSLHNYADVMTWLTTKAEKMASQKIAGALPSSPSISFGFESSSESRTDPK